MVQLSLSRPQGHNALVSLRVTAFDRLIPCAVRSICVLPSRTGTARKDARAVFRCDDDDAI